MQHAIVDQFMRAWCQRDVDAIMACFSDDAEYINIPIDPPNVGKPAIRAFIEGFISTIDEIEFVVHHQLCQGHVVMNERTDRLKMQGRWVELPVMGIFELRDDKIAKWRDYFDMGPFSAVAG